MRHCVADQHEFQRSDVGVSFAPGGQDVVDKTRLTPFGRAMTLQDKHHVRARHDPFEVIAALAVGHCKAAVFEHDTYARNAAPRIDERTIACSHAPDDGHPAGNCLAFDFDTGAGNDFPPERVDRQAAAGRRIFRRRLPCGVSAVSRKISRPAVVIKEVLQEGTTWPLTAGRRLETTAGP